MKKLIALTALICLLPSLAMAAEIQVTGTLEENKKGRAKIEGFKGCPDRDVLKRKEGMGHTDLAHSTMCMGDTNCTLSMTIPQGTPLPVYYYELDDAGQCVQKALDLSIVTNDTEYVGKVTVDAGELSQSEEELKNVPLGDTQNGKMVAKGRMMSKLQLVIQYEGKVDSDIVPFGADSLIVQY